MNCTICNKPIILNPTATERAKKFGGKPSDYTRLFTEHSTCTLAKREFETLELMRKCPRYEIHPIATCECDRISAVVINATDSASDAKELASQHSSESCWGTAILDTTTGVIDWGFGFGVKVRCP